MARLPPAEILRYYAFRAGQSAAFTLPIHVLFFQSRGLSLLEIGAIEALYTVAVVVLETPTGYVGDRIGRRRTMIAGTVLSAVGVVGFLLARSLAGFAVVVFVRAVAGAFRSGAQGAWLYETLAGDAEAASFARVSGRANAVGLATLAGASLVGAAVYTFDQAAPFLLEGAAGAVAVLVLVRMEEPDRTAGDDAEAFDPRAVLTAVRETMATRAVGPLVLAVGLLAAVGNTMQFYLQPVAVATPWLSPARLGPLYAGLTLVSAGVSARAGWLHDRLGVRGWFLTGPPLLAVGLLVVPFAPALALPVFVLRAGVSDATTPLFNQYLNDRTERGRATVLSAASTVRAAFTAPLNLVGGGIATAYALSTGLGALGAVLLVGLVLTLAAWRPGEGGD
jgi:MFS family permease